MIEPSPPTPPAAGAGKRPGHRMEIEPLGVRCAPMQRTVLLVAALTALTLLSPACGFDPDDVAVGDCFESGTAAAFGWGTEVSCDGPHTVEVFAVHDVSAALGQYPRSALEEKDGPARQQYLKLVGDLCEPEWSDYTGFGDLGSSLNPDAVVLPAIYGDMALEATPPQQWDSGNKTVICYQVFGRAGTGGEQPTVVDHPVLTTLGPTTATETPVPPQVRDCAMSSTDGQGEYQVACDRPHDREYLGHLDLTQFLGTVPGLDQAFLERFDSTTAPSQDWEVLDGVCRRIFPSLLGSDRSDIRLLAQVYTDEASWGWPAEDGSYHAACFAQPDRQITRSVVGIGDGQL